MQFGIEIDVAAFEEPKLKVPGRGWTPPPPLASFPLEVSGVVVEVGIFSRSGGPQLAGAIELTVRRLCLTSTIKELRPLFLPGNVAHLSSGRRFKPQTFSLAKTNAGCHPYRKA